MIYAVIPTGNRPFEYNNVIQWCKKNNVTPITVATSLEALGYATTDGITLNDNNKNISHWWNLGIDYAYAHEAEIVLVLNDDAGLPDNWLDAITRPLYAGASGASGERSSGRGLIAGYAFALNAGAGITADEGLVWWYGDDDIQRQCELKGGFAIVPNLPVENYYANISSMQKHDQILKDRDYFENKWGVK